MRCFSKEIKSGYHAHHRCQEDRGHDSRHRFYIASERRHCYWEDNEQDLYPLSTDDEVWAEIVDFPGYLISSFGRVFTVGYRRFLKSNSSGWGYQQVGLRRDNITYTKTVHEMVADVFLPGKHPDFKANHIDGDKNNNVYTNLEWISKSEDVRHAHRMGLNPGNGRRVQIIETGEIFDSLLACAAHVGITTPGLTYRIRKQTRGRGELTFRYVS